MADRAKLEAALRAASEAADAGDPAAAEDARRLAKALKAMPVGRDPNRPIGQVNAGIAETLGGLVDFINPFDDPAWADVAGGRFQTGSAVDAMKSGMNAIGADVATDDPENFAQSLGRGAGESAAAVIPILKGLQGLRTVGGAVGAFADDAFKSLASMAGATAEVAAGATSQAAGDEVRRQGGPEWLAGSAEVLAPAVALPAGIAGIQALAGQAGGLARNSLVGRGVSAAGRAIAPFTEAGGRSVASKRVRELVGGDERAAEMDAMIDPQNEFNLTPAQQTGDPNMLALEQTAASGPSAASAKLRAELDERLEASRAAMDDAVKAMGSNPERAQEIMAERRRAFQADLKERAEAAIASARAEIERVGPNREPADNSLIMSREIERALKMAKAEQNEIWGAINKDAPSGVANGKAKARDWLRELGQVPRAHMPENAEHWLLGDNALDENSTIRDTLALYLELRGEARNARAGVTPDKTKAKIADEIADALLKDLDAVAIGSTEADKIKYATAFSRGLHEAFDKGAPARLLKRNTNSDTYIEPELALEKTIKPGGDAADVAARQMEAAANTPQSGDAIQDYLRGLYQDAVTANGPFDAKAAARFSVKNRELLKRYPALKADLDAAAKANISADEFAKRIDTRIAALNDKRKSIGAAFLGGQPEKTISEVFKAKSPAREASKLVSEAAKDKTGETLAGLKGAFSSYLMGQPNLGAALKDPKILQAVRNVYKQEEVRRLEYVARMMDLAETATRAAPDIGKSLSGSKASSTIEFFATTLGAKMGAQAAGGVSGAQLKTASAGSARVNKMINWLAANKADEILMDAITDADLMKSLLVDAASPRFEKETLPRLFPYLAGAAVSQTDDFDLNGRPYMQGVQ